MRISDWSSDVCSSDLVSQARIASGSYDESGRIFAAVPGWMAYNGLVGGSSGWRGYRGGSAPSIQLLDFAGKTATTISGDRTTERSEERRVGKERGSTCRSRWSPYH